MCHLVGADTTGTILWRTRLTRQALMPFIAQLPPVLIGIEACGGAHDWARRFRQQGHEGKRRAPQFVTPSPMKLKLATIAVLVSMPESTRAKRK